MNVDVARMGSASTGPLCFSLWFLIRFDALLLLGFLNSKRLLDMNRAGQLSQDPIFGRSCYAEPGNTQEMPHVEAMPSASTPVNQSDFV